MMRIASGITVRIAGDGTRVFIFWRAPYFLHHISSLITFFYRFLYFGFYAIGSSEDKLSLILSSSSLSI